VADLIAAGQAAGLRLAVVSSSSLRWVAGWLVHHGLDGRFNRLVCRDHVRQVKPSPELYLLAARELDAAASECLVIEDSPNGVLAARSAGMRCLIVPNPVTASLEFPAADLRLESLAEAALNEILSRLEAS
jgi:HAD superfamily hydrolase (TIGR01509 family)